MTRRRGGLGGLLTALVLALAVVAPAGVAQAAPTQRTVAAPIHAQKAHPSARTHAVHVSSATKIVHHVDATTPPSTADTSATAAVTVVEQLLTGLVGLTSPTALGRGPPAP